MIALLSTGKACFEHNEVVPEVGPIQAYVEVKRGTAQKQAEAGAGAVYCAVGEEI